MFEQSQKCNHVCKLGISRRVFVSLGLAWLGCAGAHASERFKLVMVEAAGCVYCARWHAEVGHAYTNSAEGRFAPLQRVSIGDPSLSYLGGLQYTPTFVLVEGQREIGRITGYPGADFFWSLLAGLLAKTTFAAPSAENIKT